MNSAAMTKLAAGLLCLLLISMVYAADKNKASQFREIDIRVQARGFGGAGAADITAVLQSAAGELFRYWPGTQLRVSMCITEPIIHKPIQDAWLETRSQSD